MPKKAIEYTKSSGNIYQDLGYADADESMAKAQLAVRIHDIIEKRHLKQVEAAQLLSINQPKISALMNGQLRGFSMERLIHFLNLLNQDVEIVVKPKRSRRQVHGRLKIAMA
ncbi:MAG: helix-turn-helix transcriptional regulator [Pseudomonadota bacterium]